MLKLLANDNHYHYNQQPNLRALLILLI